MHEPHKPCLGRLAGSCMCEPVPPKCPSRPAESEGMPFGDSEEVTTFEDTEVSEDSDDRLDAEDPELTQQLRAVKSGRSLVLAAMVTAMVAVGWGIALVV